MSVQPSARAEGQGAATAPRFFERDQLEAIRRQLRPDLQVAVAIEYAFGWRCQGGILTFQRRQLDFEAGALRLDAASTKNEDGRAWATAYIRIRAGLFRVEPVAGSDKIGKVPIMLRTTSDGRQSGTLRQGGSAARPRGLHVWDRDSGDRPRPRRVPGAWHRRERGGHRPGAPRSGVVRGVGDVRRRRRAVASRPGCPAPSTLSSRATMPFPTS